jgi:transposase
MMSHGPTPHRRLPRALSGCHRRGAAIDAGLPRREAAQHFRVSLRTIDRWVARHRRGESLADKPRSGRPPKLQASHYPVLRTLVARQPDATLPEVARQLAAAVGVQLSPSHLSRLLARLDLPLKKSR